MDYSIETLKTYLDESGNSNLTTLLTNMSREFYFKTWLIESTFSIISDESFIQIDKNNMISLAKMLKSYSNRCWHIAISKVELDKLLKYRFEEIYYTKVFEGLRVSTTGEIARGVKGLEIKQNPRISDENYKRLCLLQWTFEGKSYYYKQAGYEVTYDKSGKVKEDFYTLLKRAANGLVDLFDWLDNTDEYDKCITVLKKASKAKAYKYPSYSPDEIDESISIKTLLNSAKKTIKPGSTNEDYRRALHLLIKSDKYKLTPLEISFIRTTYEKYIIDSQMSGGDVEQKNNKADVIESVKKKCETLVNERYKGKIDKDHFVYKIITTLKGYNYTRCSEKQMAIIDSAYNLIRNDKDNSETIKETPSTPVISDFDIDKSLSSLSDVFGNSDIFAG